MASESRSKLHDAQGWANRVRGPVRLVRLASLAFICETRILHSSLSRQGSERVYLVCIHARCYERP